MKVEYGDSRCSVLFWKKVVDTGDCWIWYGAVSGGGYGTFGATGMRRMAAHRYSYLALVGPFDEGLEIDHLCRIRSCVNPAHLEPVTPEENRRRAQFAGPAPKQPRKIPSRFRHQPITKMLENGAPEETVRATAGHVSEEMMRHYSHIRMQAKRAAVDGLVSRFAQKRVGA